MNMRKVISLFFVLMVLLVPVISFAQTESSTCSSSDEGGFVSLTCIKNLEFAGNASELPAFFNSIYMICIGLAAVIGVLQIMRAGVTWMTAAGSHEKIGEAKNLVRDTIIGLILVLAPTIVFSIINPDILSLRIGNLDKLAPGAEQGGTSTTASGTGTTLWSNTEAPRAEAKAQCEAVGGTAYFTCTNTQTKAARTVAITEACGAGEDGITICRSTSNTDIGKCSDYARFAGPFPEGTVCDATKGYIQVNAQQCLNKNDGVYCGNKYSIDKPPKALGCSVAYGNKTDLGFDQTAELCCNTQDAEGIQCESQKISKNGMTDTLMCSCSYSN